MTLKKIKRVLVQPMPLHDGEVIETSSKAKKRFAVRLAKQKPGVFEFDEEGAITVFIVARGREAAMDLIAERICGRRCLPEDDKAMKAICGRWYDGDIVSMEIVGMEKVD